MSFLYSGRRTSGRSRLVYERFGLTLTTLSPDQAINGGTVVLNCFGTNFLESCVIYYDGQPQTTDYHSETLVTANNVAVGAAGEHLVEIRDAATGRVSDPLAFTAT